MAFTDKPLEFLPQRHITNPHIAFGRGAHMCLGQFLARAQIEEGIHVLAQRLANPKLTGDIAWRSFPGAWGPATLLIEFEPASVS